MTIEEALEKCVEGQIALNVPSTMIPELSIEEIEFEPESDRYIVVVVSECRICLERQMSAYPDDLDDEENLECQHCSNNTSEPVTDNIWMIVVENE